MKKSEIFETVLDVVCDFVEVTPDEALSKSRKEDNVTARCLITVLCSDFGLLNCQIQKLLGFKSHYAITHLLTMAANRRATDRYFRILYAEISHELDKTMLATGQ